MDKRDINTIEEILKKYNGEDVVINTSHKLYGAQKIKCKLDYIFDAERVGFRVNSGQNIFVHRNEIVDYGIKDGIYFADDLMEIKIKLNK